MATHKEVLQVMIGQQVVEMFNIPLSAQTKKAKTSKGNLLSVRAVGEALETILINAEESLTHPIEDLLKYHGLCSPAEYYKLCINSVAHSPENATVLFQDLPKPLKMVLFQYLLADRATNYSYSTVQFFLNLL